MKCIQYINIIFTYFYDIHILFMLFLINNISCLHYTYITFLIVYLCMFILLQTTLQNN